MTPDAGVRRYPAEAGSPWAGETWAVEVEISRKTIDRIAGVMHESHGRAEARVRGRPVADGLTRPVTGWLSRAGPRSTSRRAPCLTAACLSARPA
jgi:hypothetical protein